MSIPHGDPQTDGDPLVEALLEELLGGQHPPDLREQILSRWQATQSARPIAPPAGRELVIANGRVPERVSRRARTRFAKRRRTVLASSSLVLAAWAAWSIGWLPTDAFSPIAQQETSLSPANQAIPATGIPRPDRQPSIAAEDPPALADNPNEQTPGIRVPQRRDPERQRPDNQATERPGPANLAHDPIHANHVASDDRTSDPSQPGNRSSRPAAVAENDGPSPSAPPATRMANEQLVARVNALLRQGWERSGVQPAPEIDDSQWCRRTFWALIGREPAERELSAYLQVPASQRRDQLIDRLLSEQVYRQLLAKRVADRWSTAWLASVARELRDFRTLHAGLSRYLEEAVLGRIPLDQVVQRLLVAEGSNLSGSADFDPATNYLLAVWDEQGARPTAEVCRAFLGQRTQCARCHDDPISRTPQHRYWQMAAIWQTLDRQVIRPGRMRLVPVTGVGESQPASVIYDLPDGRQHTAQAADLSGNPLSVRTDRSPREEFAQRLTTSDAFAQAMVNRVWADLHRFGFTDPVDDLGRHNRPLQAETLELLADQFRAANFDLDTLLRWTLASDSFSRSELLSSANDKDLPEAGAPVLFSRFYQRPVLFDDSVQGLAQVARGRDESIASWVPGPTTLRVLEARRQGKTDPERRPGRGREADSRMLEAGTWLPISWRRIARMLSDSPMSTEAKLQHAFLVVLARTPTSEELASAVALFELERYSERPDIAVENVLWTLRNTREYQQGH